MTAAIAFSRSAYAVSVPAFERAGDADRACALRFLRRVVAEIESQRAPMRASSARN